MAIPCCREQMKESSLHLKEKQKLQCSPMYVYIHCFAKPYLYLLNGTGNVGSPCSPIKVHLLLNASGNKLS